MSLCDNAEALIVSYLNSSKKNGVEVDEMAIMSRNWSAVNDTVFQHWCHYSPISWVAHYLIGTILVFICVACIGGNALVILVFTRYRRLRNSANTLIVNLAVSDLLNGFLHPMAVYSSYKRAWMFKKLGCELYGSLCGLFGLVSIVTLMAIAIERCLVISVKPFYGDVHLTTNKTKQVIVLIWLYCVAAVLPPFFGWGAFVPEGFLTSCSFDYLTRTFSNRTYFIYLFMLGFFIPLTVIILSYSFIYRTVYVNERDMKLYNVNKIYTRRVPRQRNDYKAAGMILFVIGMFLLSWTPYSIVAMLGQFGYPDVLGPWISVLPSIFAKMSCVYNPAIYSLSHRHFRATLRKFIYGNQTPTSNDRIFTRFSKASLPKNRPVCPCAQHKNVSIDLEGSSSCSGKKCYIGVTIQETAFQCKNIFSAPEVLMDNYNTLTAEVHVNATEMRDALKSSVVHVAKPRGQNSLFRKLLFRSDSSLYQRYNTVLEKGHIVRVCTAICTCQKKDVSNFDRNADMLIERDLKSATSSLQVNVLTPLSLSTSTRTCAICMARRPYSECVMGEEESSFNIGLCDFHHSH